jgi:hypothetical protein
MSAYIPEVDGATNLQERGEDGVFKLVSLGKGNKVMGFIYPVILPFS